MAKWVEKGVLIPNIDIADINGLEDVLNSKSGTSHIHDDRYYTEEEINSKLSGKSDVKHEHTIESIIDLRGTIDNINEKIADKANMSHSHSASQITSGTITIDRLPSITDDKISGMSSNKLIGVIPSENLPSYVDDVLEYNGISVFPDTGEIGKIYVDTVTNKTYRWGGSSYVEISASLALGLTSSTAFRGDYGNVAYQHAQAKGSQFASGLYKISTNNQGHVISAAAVTKQDIVNLGIPGQDTNTTYSLATGSIDGLMSSEDKAKIDGIASGANKYIHPANAIGAKSSGLYKIATDANGHVISVSSVTKSDIVNLGIPAQDTNTTYTNATSSKSGLMSSSDKSKLDAMIELTDEEINNIFSSV